jgi:uroporphyrinogen-III synthase
MNELAGLTVVITRPEAQAESLASLLEAHGAAVIRYPVLAITAVDAATLKSNFAATPVAQCDALIFVSANAVKFGVEAIRAGGGLRAGQVAYAIGAATAEALRARSVANVVSPSPGNDSEALLAMPPLQKVAGQTIVIVKGLSESGGRKLLEQTLRARGAAVAAFNCYTRCAITPPAKARHALTLAPAASAFSVLSVETLDSLDENLRRDGREDVYASGMMLVPHPRICAAARAAGWQNVEVVPMANAGMLAALAELKSRTPGLVVPLLKKVDQG